VTVSTVGGAPSENGAEHPGIEQMLKVAVEAFRVVAEDAGKSRRMADATTTCALHITDIGETTGFTALLDRDPIEVVDHVLPDAVSRIHGPSEAWLPVFLTGNLGIAILRGDLKFEGPVREFLRVFPIFRTAYAEVARGRRSRATAEPSAA
jgi:hypothetical protein